MFKYVLKRLGLCCVTVFVILSLTFILFKLLPIQVPIGTDNQRASYCEKQIYYGYFYKSEQPVDTDKFIMKYSQQIEGKTVTYYYYQVPIMTQYFNWLKNIFTEWDWGLSTKILPNNKVMPIILQKLPTSLKINIWATLLSVPLGIAIGIWAALKKNTPTDHTISTLIMVFISIPSFVLITLLMYTLCYKANLLPTQWAGNAGTLQMRIRSYIIPVACLSFGSICGYGRFMRAELCEVMESEYLLLARTKGLTRRQAIMRHALRNAMVPILPSILSEFIGILSGSMILESLYGIPGIGSLFIDAINGQDYNVLFVDMALTTTISLVASVFLDISYGILDPRIRMGAKK